MIDPLFRFGFAIALLLVFQALALAGVLALARRLGAVQGRVDAIGRVLDRFARNERIRMAALETLAARALAEATRDIGDVARSVSADHCGDPGCSWWRDGECRCECPRCRPRPGARP